MFNFKSKNILVIGGSGHLGLEISKSFLKYGANLIVVGRNLSKLDKIIKFADKQKLKKPKIFNFNVSSLKDLERLNKSLSKKNIDCLINLAFTDTTRGYFQNLSIEKINDHIMEHSKNYIYPTKVLINRLKSKSSIIFFNSIWSEVSPNLDNHELLKNLPSIPQSYSKSGLNGFMRQLAIELSSKKITVNCISPGYFPRKKGKPVPKYINKLCKNIPLGRIGKPRDLVGITLLLASEYSDYITGQNIIVDGGYTTI